ncbi:multicopper oxidase family protein [Acidocella sp.]|uniref:multicopper oxidase family protein n=1 Tax=Acidocella sp. TaxID=50710 RepID=UPI00261FA409|nr:multicopper oxidase domain-containing protein [Acidocella sp.]MDD2796097.1 multicopper oxidase domain-containing protein [Acidocella sp.]
MNKVFSRRQVMLAGAATAAFSTLPAGRASAAPARVLTVGKRSIEVNGKAASVFAIQGADGRPGAVLAPGERFATSLVNQCGEPTIIHWHGQTPPVRQDGVTETGYETLIADGAAQGYDFAPRPGTHWMHSHQGLQEQQLMAAPLIVRTAAEMQEDRQEIIVLLHDFTFKSPAEILAGLTGGGGMGGSAGGGMMGNMGGMMSGKSDLNDVDFDAYLANGRTLADPEVFQVEAGGRIRLRLINGAAATAFWIDTGALPGRIIAVDGDAVQPLAVGPFPLAAAQRVDIVLDLPPGEGAYPILAQREGDVARAGVILAASKARIARLESLANIAAGPCGVELEVLLRGAQPLLNRPFDRVTQVHLTGGMMGYDWGIDGRQWQNHQPILVKQGERVGLDIINDGMMAHPMHLHGHHFQVVAINGSALPGAMRDTVLVPPMGSVRIAFDADNPGRWLFHCHNLYHMAAGMMTELRYV